MSDEELRALERQFATTPDEETGAKLFNARSRSGFEVDTAYALRNSRNGKYLRDWARYGDTSAYEVASLKDLAFHSGLFKTRESVYKEIKAMQRGRVTIGHYQVVEIQTMRQETPGPLIKDIQDEIEVELLRAKKDAQLQKLKKLEVEEQALLEIKKKQEKEKLAKLQEKEAVLQKKLAKAKKKEVSND